MHEINTAISAYIKKIYSEKTAQDYLEYINSKPAQYIRINRLKTKSDDLISSLKNSYEIESEPISNIPGYLKILKGEDKTGKTIQHILGEYYIQSLSSMLPALALNPGPQDIILDLCAAPGSKTTQLGEMMQNEGTLIANEISLDRVKMLVFNIDRMNLVNTGVIHSRGEILSKIYPSYFDKILVDAPCSGLGIIQKKNEVNDWWSLKRISVLGDLQLKLLIAAIKMAKKDGEIIYSTCTLTVEENELIINKILEKYPVVIDDINLPVKSYSAFKEYEGQKLNPALYKAHRILPWEINSEGFFIVRLKKIEDLELPESIYEPKNNLELLSFDNKKIYPFLINVLNTFGLEKETLQGYNYLIKGTDIYFITNTWKENNLNIFQRIGTRFGTIDKNNRTILHTQAAQILKNAIKKNIFELNDNKELKSYLEGGVINEHLDSKGQCVVKYRGQILGTAVITKQGIKSQFPRSKRTQEIVLPD